MIFFARISSGVLTVLNRARFLGEISRYKDGLYEIIIRRKNRRSTQQNRYLWGCVIWEIRNRLQELGNDFDADQVHEFLKDRFNQVQIVGEGGEVLGSVGGSTAKMNKEEFGLYLDKIIQWAAEVLQITIPAPGEQTEIEL